MNRSPIARRASQNDDGGLLCDDTFQPVTRTAGFRSWLEANETIGLTFREVIRVGSRREIPVRRWFVDLRLQHGTCRAQKAASATINRQPQPETGDGCS